MNRSLGDKKKMPLPTELEGAFGSSTTKHPSLAGLKAVLSHVIECRSFMH
jgi:hypothetical protein